MCVISGLGMAFVEIAFSACIVVVLQIIGLVPAQNSGLLSALDFINSQNAFIVLLVLGFARALMYIYSGISAIAADEIFISRLKIFAIQSLLKKDAKFLETSKIGALFADSFPKASLFFLYSAQALAVAAQIVVLLFILLKSSVIYTAIGMGYLLVVGGMVFLIQRKVQKLVAPMPAISERLFQGIFRVIKNWFLIRVFRIEKIEETRNTRLVTYHASKTNYSHFLSMISVNLPTALGIALIVVFMVIHQKYALVSNQVFVSYLYLFLRFVQQLSQITTMGGMANVNFPHFKRVQDYFRELDFVYLRSLGEPSEGIRIFTDEKEDSLQLQLRDLEQKLVLQEQASQAPKVQFENLSFRYSDSSDDVIKGLRLDVHEGQQVVITGESGAGKSTLLALLLGMLEPTEGRILIGGMPSDKFFEKASGHVGYTGVDPFLIDGTLRENLTYGNPYVVSDEDIEESLAGVGLRNFMRTLPQGLETEIDERGSTLSTGQKQRLAMARSLLRKPALLILDEVSANLDENNEKLLAETVANLKGRCTVIIVTHRLGMAAFADHLIQLSPNR
jgi:ABC-type multidrug transport system fused ATPase/permease subunit